MKFWTAISAMLLLSICAAAQTARKSCDDLKSEIAKKLEDKGVTSYTLEVVVKGKESTGKIVGSCDGGTKSLVYSKTNGEAPKEQPQDSSKPQ